jgi:hypothetical protein
MRSELTTRSRSMQASVDGLEYWVGLNCDSAPCPVIGRSAAKIGGGMRGILFVLTLTAALVVAILVFTPLTYAASPAQDCSALGGTYTAAGPDSTCTFPGEPVGKSDNTKGGSQETGPGKSEPNEEETTCTGVNNKPHACP